MTAHVDHATEIFASDGPTGDFARVVRGELRDAGGNVLFRGTAEQCAAQRWRIPTRLVATETDLAGQVSGCDVLWGHLRGPNA